MDNWPNFFIVGADKAGTSSLYAYLSEVPGIFMSPIKEPNYFSIKTIPDNHQLKPIRDKQKYLALFKGVKYEKIVGEASPSYLADPEAAKLIHQVSPNAKILISLRDPVERVYSNYLMLKRIGLLKSKFHDEIQMILQENRFKNDFLLNLDTGLYYENIKRFIDIFGNDQVRIIIFEEFIKNPKTTLNEILNFLHLESKIVNFKPEIYNKYGVVRGLMAQKILQSRTIRSIAERLISPPKRRFLKEKFILKEATKPPMTEEDRILLVNYYLSDVQKIKNLLNRELPWKNFVSIH